MGPLGAFWGGWSAGPLGSAVDNERWRRGPERGIGALHPGLLGHKTFLGFSWGFPGPFRANMEGCPKPSISVLKITFFIAGPSKSWSSWVLSGTLVALLGSNVYDFY